MRVDQYELDAELAEHHWWWRGRRKVLANLLGRHCRQGNDREILEVGCSTGSNLAMLSEFGNVTALEMHEPTAELCRRRHPSVPVILGSIPLRLDQTFDLICLFDVLEHIEDDNAALHWIDQHLRPGGLVALTVPAFPFLWSRHDELAHHFRRYRRAELLELLKETFKIRYHSYFNFHLFPLIALVRICQRFHLLREGEREKAVGGKGWVNRSLTAILGSEIHWLRWTRLPFGVSLVAIAEKRG